MTTQASANPEISLGAANF